MSNEVLVALLALVGTLSGTFGGILTSSKLTAYRIKQLEDKVDKHNKFAERLPLVEAEIKHINEKVDDVENYVNNVNSKLNNMQRRDSI